jgi:hypothetical protein
MQAFKPKRIINPNDFCAANWQFQRRYNVLMLLAYGHSKVLSLDDCEADFRELTANVVSGE